MLLSRRASVVLLGLGFLVIPTLLFAVPGEQAAQPAVQDLPPASATTFSAGFTLPTDLNFKKKLGAVHDYVKEQAWREATQLLQALLDAREDTFVSLLRTGTDGKETIYWTSARAEANRLLGLLPPLGLEYYEATYGPPAAALLIEARRENNTELLAQVAQRYLHTKAGAQATEDLGTYYLDRSRFVMAALCYERLLDRRGNRDLPPLTLFKAALAFQRLGDAAGRDRAWNALTARGIDSVHVGDRVVGLADLRNELDRQANATRDPLTAHAWTMYRGDAGRSGVTAGSTPLLEPRWQEETIREAAPRAWIHHAVQQHATRALPVLPAASPVVAGGKVIYRSQHGIEARDLKTGKRAWESASRWGLDNLARNASQLAYVDSWINSYLGGPAHVLFENAVVGTLSADNTHVYAVDDLAVPPYPQNVYGAGGRLGQGLNLASAPALNDAVYYNRLEAIDLDSGKLVWEQGGRAVSTKGAAGGPLLDSYFLGPPLPLGGKLYVLAEKDQDLRLVCLDPRHGAVNWIQTLGSARKKMPLDGLRRTQAAPVAYGQGLLICPTNGGGIVAVDLLSHSLVWAHSYREEEPLRLEDMPVGRFRGRRPIPLPPPSFDSEWKLSAPIVTGRKVLVTPPDAPVLLCLDLQDGALIWKAARQDDDLFLGGVADGKVILVGKRSCRAVRLADGAEAWSVKTGLPTGQGMIVGKTYYLPLKAPPPGEQVPAVCAIDLARGRIKEELLTPADEPLGNLVWCGEHVISQTVDRLMVFRQQGRCVASTQGENAPAHAALPLGPERLAGLLDLLGSRSFAEREAAANELDRIGPAALEALRKATKSSDREIRARAERLVGQLERQAETARVLVPHRFQLAYRDKPVGEVIADVARKTGWPIELPPGQARTLDRKITLDTGDATFWEAMDQLCHKAGLVERAPAVDNTARTAGYQSQSIMMTGNRIVIDDSRGRPGNADELAGRLLLEDGKPQAVPTCYAGALRLRALPSTEPRAPGETHVSVEVMAEPGLQWQRVFGTRIDRALDDQDQLLPQLVNYVREAPDPNRARSNVIIRGMPVLTDDGGPSADPRQVTLRLKPGEHAARSLKELRGTITAQVQTQPQPLMTVHDILHATGKSVESPGGGLLRVMELSHEEQGRIKLRVHLGAPLRRADPAGGLGFAGIVIVNGKAIGESEESISARPVNFVLLDTAGKPFQLVEGGSVEVRNLGRFTQEFELTYAPSTAQKGPARLVYQGWRTAIVEVPFVLKDVPLP